MTGQGFVNWLVSNRWRNDQIGHLARRLHKDRCLPKRIRSAEGLLIHLIGTHHEEEWVERIRAAEKEWLVR